MKLKTSVLNKVNKMTKDDLINLINNLCESNEDVVSYLNNVLSNSKIDSEKYITNTNTSD